MKKILFVLITVFLLTSCSVNKEYQNNNKINITTTIFPYYDFSLQISGKSADVSMLLPAGSDSHSFEPTPKDIIQIADSDVFIYTGGESDSWIEDILKDINNPELKTIKISEFFPSVSEHSHTIDEHYWTSPQNAIKICEKIKEILCEIDSENKNIYENNFSDYKLKLNELDNEFKNVKTYAKRNILVFGDRFPFKHLTDAYNIEYASAFPGCSEETEPDMKTIMSLIELVKKDNVPVVFYTDFSNHKIADTICAETNAELSMLRSCHTITNDEFLSGITYLEIMNDNLSKIKEALE